MRSFFIVLIHLIVILHLPLAAGNDGGLSNISPGDVYLNPLGLIGKNIQWTGRIEKVISVSLPLGMMMNSGGYLWYVKIFDAAKIQKGSVRDGNTVTVRGIYLSKEKVMFQGGIIEVPSVLGGEVILEK